MEEKICCNTCVHDGALTIEDVQFCNCCEDYCFYSKMEIER